MSRQEREARDLEHRERCRARRRKEERGVFLFLTAALVFLLSCGGLIYYFVGYSLAGREYRELSRKYVLFEDVPYEVSRSGSVTAHAAEQILTEDEYPALQIDFQGLKEINPDFTGWIYIPGAEASYPLVQAADNDYYLNRTFEGNTSSNGAIFLDYRDSKILSGFNTFIYGHNMKNGSMFGNLRDYCQDEELLAAYPYFFVYLPDGTVMKYQVFSHYLTDGDSDSYDRPVNIEEERAYLDKIIKKSAVKHEIEENRIDTYVTLSTCAGAAGSGQRYLVHGACVGIY